MQRTKGLKDCAVERSLVDVHSCWYGCVSEPFIDESCLFCPFVWRACWTMAHAISTVN